MRFLAPLLCLLMATALPAAAAGPAVLAGLPEPGPDPGTDIRTCFSVFDLFPPAVAKALANLGLTRICYTVCIIPVAFWCALA